MTKGPLMALGHANDITSIVQIWNADASTDTKIGATLLYGQDYLGATCFMGIGAFYGAQIGTAIYHYL